MYLLYILYIQYRKRASTVRTIALFHLPHYFDSCLSGLFHVYNYRMSNPKKARTKCLRCGGEPARATYKYCSNVCQMEYQHLVYIQKWMGRKVSGLQSIGTVSPHVKRYLRQKFGNRCCVCGWAEKNVKTGKTPLVADHIDGNWRNNDEKNLRLLCPNCDSLTPTYAGLNRGNGRKHRALSNRVKEARSLLEKRKQ